MCYIEKTPHLCFNNDKLIVIIILLSDSWPVLSSVQLPVLKLLIIIKAFIGFCQSLQAYNLKYVTAISNRSEIVYPVYVM